MLGVDLVETGFETAEIDGLMLLDDDEDLAAGEAPAPQRLETAVSRPGDIWLLGDHRVAQGDARDAALYERLMLPGELAQLVLTDEPYNVTNVGHVTSNADHREFAFRHRQSNGIRRRVARHARSQATPYPARARHSVNAIERLCL